MKISKIILVLLCTLFINIVVLPSAESCPDYGEPNKLTGYWEGSCSWNSSTWQDTLHIGLGMDVRRDGEITGVVGFNLYGGTYRVKGWIKGDIIEFSCIETFYSRNTSYTHITFKGIIKNYSIEGNWEKPNKGYYGTFYLTRHSIPPGNPVRPHLTGYWEGNYNWDSLGDDTWVIGLGIDVNSKGNITGIIGVYTWGFYGRRIYKVNGQVKGNKIEFSYKGDSYNHIFTGKIEGPHIIGNWERSDGHYGTFYIKKYSPEDRSLEEMVAYPVEHLTSSQSWVNWRKNPLPLAQSIFDRIIKLVDDNGKPKDLINYLDLAYPGFSALGDLNSDGQLDMVGANFEEPTISVFIQSNGILQPSITYYTSHNPYSVDVGDINNDGKDDVIVTSHTYRILYVDIFLQEDGELIFYKTLEVNGPCPVRNVGIFDANSDELTDIILPDGIWDNLFILKQQTDGTFSTSTKLKVGYHPNSVAIADMNNDGFRDIIVANAYEDTISVLLQYKGHFTNEIIYKTGKVPVIVIAGDHNGDGLDDIAVANRPDKTVGIFLQKKRGRKPKTIRVPKDYLTIQEAADVAGYGDIIKVAEGKFKGAKLRAGIKLVGSGTDKTEIHGIINTADGCTVENLAVIGGYIRIEEGIKNVVIRRLLLKGGGYGIIAFGGNNTFIAENNTIINHGCIDENGYPQGAGIYYKQNSSVIIRNNIIANNPGYGIVTWWYNSTDICQYNDVYNNGKNYVIAKPGEGSISVDPLFRDEENGDYRLTKNSLCIDAGDPDEKYNDPDGSRNDMGSFPYVAPDVTVEITKVPDKILKNHKYVVEWKLEGGFKEVDQTEILWGLISGEYTHSGNSFSGEQKEFKDKLRAPKMKKKKLPFYIYLVAHALVEGEDFYSKERKIKVIHDRGKRKKIVKKAKKQKQFYKHPVKAKKEDIIPVVKQTTTAEETPEQSKVKEVTSYKAKTYTAKQEVTSKRRPVILNILYFKTLDFNLGRSIRYYKDGKYIKFGDIKFLKPFRFYKSWEEEEDTDTSQF